MIIWVRLKLWATLFQCSFHLNYPHEVLKLFDNSPMANFLKKMLKKSPGEKLFLGEKIKNQNAVLKEYLGRI